MVAKRPRGKAFARIALLVLMFLGLALETSGIPILLIIAVLAVGAFWPVGIGFALVVLSVGVCLVVTVYRVRPRSIYGGSVWRGSRAGRLCLSVVTLGNVALVLGGIAWVFVRPEPVEGLDVVLGSSVAGGLLHLRVSGPIGRAPTNVAR